MPGQKENSDLINISDVENSCPVIGSFVVMIFVGRSLGAVPAASASARLSVNSVINRRITSALRRVLREKGRGTQLGKRKNAARLTTGWLR